MFFIFKNIAQFVKHSKIIFAVFAICEITSLMLMIFSFGIYQNYSQEIKDVASDEPIDDEREWLSFSFNSDIDEDAPVSNGSVSAFLDELGECIGDKIGEVYFNCNGHDVILSYNNGWEMYDMSANLKKNRMWYGGSFFTEDDYDSAAFVCVAPIECYKELDDELGYDDEVSTEDYSFQAYDKDGKIYVDMYEGTFEVIGFTQNWGDRYYVPYTVFSSDAEVSTLPRVEIKQVLYQNEYDGAVSVFKKYFGGRISDEESSDMPVYDTEVLKTFQAKMTICIVIAVICSINITALFKFVIDIRRRDMAIFRINGCSKGRLKRMILGEMTIYSAVNILICIFGFQLLILPRISETFKYVAISYSAKNYLLLAAIYAAVTLLFQNIMLELTISRSPVQMLKKRR